VILVTAAVAGFVLSLVVLAKLQQWWWDR